MSLLICNKDCSLTDFAREQQVGEHVLWPPIKALLPFGKDVDTTVTVDPHTPMALLENATDTLVLDKRVICARLGVPDSCRGEKDTVLVDPGVVPRDCEVFVRWRSPDKVRLTSNMRVLHYDLEKDVGASPPSSPHGLKRSRVDGEAESDCTIVPTESLGGNKYRISLAEQSREDLHRRLAAVINARGRQLHPRSTHILQSTLASMCRRLSHPPLHFVVSSDATSIEAAGLTWARSHRRILSRVFRSTSSAERSEASKYCDGSRQLRFYFIEDVLLRRPREWSATAAARCQGDGNGVGVSEPVSYEVELLIKDEVLADMNSFSERGFRIVFIEHYPALHHGSRYMMDRTLSPVARLCLERCPHLTVTVVISAMSCVTAARRQGMMMSLVLSHTGLLSFFISELNTSLPPDPKTAAVVGSSDRGSPFLKTLHADFARNASLTYVDVKDLQRKRET